MSGIDLDAQRAAYRMGCANARTAAIWVRMRERHEAVELLALLDANDRVVEPWLPEPPNLSGRWADYLTVATLFAAVMGRSPLATDARLVAVLEARYDEGVADTFKGACADELRRRLA